MSRPPGPPSVPEPGRRSGAGRTALPPRAIRYQGPAGWQVAVLLALWAGAIGLAVVLGSGIPPAEQGTWASQARTLWPIVVAFVGTIYVLVQPRGPVRTHETRGRLEAFTVVRGQVRDAAGRQHAVTVVAPTVEGSGGVAVEETLELALEEASRAHPGAAWVGTPELRAAGPAEQAAVRDDWEARDREAPASMAWAPRRPALATLAVLAGCAWVSLLPLAVITVKAGYERVVLAPVCREHGLRQSLAYRGVRFSISNQPWWHLDAPTEVRCLYANTWDNGTVDVPLARISGRGRSFLLTGTGAVAVVGGGLLLWAVPSALVAIGLVARGRRRRTEA